MNNLHYLNQKIFAISTLIQVKYPELEDSINEFTVTIPDEQRPSINYGNLNEFYKSLESILEAHDTPKQR
jgi:hypothetical protein